MPRGKFDRGKLGPRREYVMSPKKAAKIDKMIEVAEKELEETRVNFRWGREQLELVKRVAAMIGVPYQTYIKQVVYRQCLEDLKMSKVTKEKIDP